MSCRQDDIGNLTGYLAEMLALLTSYLAVYGNESERLRVLIEQLQGQDEGLCFRHGLPGHLTASALVIDVQTDSALLIRHKFLQRWLQPGGHLDPGENPVQGALRELHEEVGRLKVRLFTGHPTADLPVDIDSHAIPANDSKKEAQHLHHDFQYVFVLEEHVPIHLQADEVSDYRWARLDELRSGQYGARLARTIGKVKTLCV